MWRRPGYLSIRAVVAPRTHLDDNFTRAYYSASGARVLSGSSEERVVRVHCARTARLLDEAEM